MPHLRADAILLFGLIGVFALSAPVICAVEAPEAVPTQAAARQGLFSAPQVSATYARTLLEEGENFLALKKAAFVNPERQGDFVLVAPEKRYQAPDGGYLLELRGYFDSRVSAAVDYDSGAGYAYATGDELTIRLYAAILFDIAAEGMVQAHLYRPLALQNMSNPRNRDEQFTLIKRIAARDVFTADDRQRLFADEEAGAVEISSITEP